MTSSLHLARGGLGEGIETLSTVYLQPFTPHPNPLPTRERELKQPKALI
jgi:hypothetical protein